MHDLRKALGYPGEREKCRLRIVVGKELKDAIDVTLDSTFPFVPVFSVDM